MKTGKIILSIIYLFCMLALISDYKVLCNIVGSVTTITTLFYLFVTRKGHQKQLERNATNGVFLFLLYYTVTSFLNFNPQEWGIGLMMYLMVFTPFFLNKYLHRIGDIKTMAVLVIGFFVIWTIFIILCYTTCSLIPNLARMMASDRGRFYTIINGGGYFMGYGSSVLATYLFDRLIHGEFKGKVIKILVIIEILFMGALLIVITSYVMQIALVAGLIFATINRFVAKSHFKWITGTIAVFLLFILYTNLGSILGYLSNNIDNEILQRRLQETYDSAVSGDDSYHVGERERVYQVSVDGFFINPLFGNGYKNGNVFAGEESNNIGNHSTILDSLAQFGVVGAMPLFAFLLYPFYSARKRKQYWAHIVPFYVMSSLNPILKCYHVMVIMYLIIPCMEFIRQHATLVSTKKLSICRTKLQIALKALKMADVFVKGL